MANNINSIHNSNGRFHVGMTLKEAQAKGVDKCTFRRDFYNLDKDCDGVLSLQEIMEERKRDANTEKWTAIGWGAFSILDFATYRNKSSKIIWGIIDALVIGFSAFNYFKIKKQDEEYQKIIDKHNSKINLKA